MPSGVEHDAVVRRALVQTVWLNKSKYEDAESAYQHHLAKLRSGNVKKDKPSETRVDAVSSSSTQSVETHKSDKTAAVKASKAAKAGKNQSQLCPKAKKDSCQLAEKGALRIEHGTGDNLTALQQKLNAVESDNQRLTAVIEKLNNSLQALDKRVAVLEKGKTGESKPAEIKAPAAKVEDDDDVDLFGSDEDDNAEREKLHDQRVKAYEEKKSKKAAIIAKSNIILDVKPWDDETDMKKMEECVRAIQLDGLVWGAAKLVPLAYGIFKLQISCVVEDDKVSVDDLQEKIEGLEELVQSVDIAAFNKV